MDKYGNSMMDLAKEKFTAGYLDLYGLTVTNKSTGAVTFAVGPTGLITINGQVTMGAEHHQLGPGEQPEHSIQSGVFYGQSSLQPGG